MATVYMTVAFPDVASKVLDEAGIDHDGFSGEGLITKEELLKHVGDVKVLIANFGAGFNNIDTAYARKKGIDVTNTPFVSSVATAEIASGLAIALSRRIVEGDHVMRTVGFDGWAPLFFRGHELAGKTLGIVGLGDIGKNVAQRLAAFDMKILYTQRHQVDPAVEAHYGATYVSLDELLEQSDIVSLHCPLTPATTHMIAAPQFNKYWPEIP